MNTATMTNDGLLIPKEWLSGFSQFEIIREVGRIIIKSAQLPKVVSTLSEKPLNAEETFNQQVVADKPVTTDNSAAVPMDAEYAEAMRSYMSRQAQRISDPSQPYPTRDSLYDRNVLRGQ
jgi:hypothetical protein